MTKPTTTKSHNERLDKFADKMAREGINIMLVPYVSIVDFYESEFTSLLQELVEKMEGEITKGKISTKEYAINEGISKAITIIQSWMKS